MSNNPLTYTLQIGDFGPHPAREVKGTEAVFAPFRFEVRLPIEGGLPGAPEELLKKGAILEMQRDREHVRRVCGVVTEISTNLAVRGVPEIFAVIEPQLALLRHRVDYRVFRDKTVPQIVTEVVSIVGIAPGAEAAAAGLSLRLSGSYATRPYTVQCRESDLDFIHRLLEEEGIFYYFLEEGGLVLGDSPGAYENIAGSMNVPFRGGLGLDMNEDAVIAVARRSSVSVGKVSLGDINLQKPNLSLRVESAGPTKGGPEYYDYPGGHADPAAGERTASLMAAARAVGKAGFAGVSLSGRLVPGHLFDLDGTPASLADGRHVVKKVSHDWQRDKKGFSCDFESLDGETTIRPPRATPAPILPNPMTGIVTGPGDIHTDATGQVKVHFPWDRVQPQDENCSDWIPVLQDNTGKSMAIPRVGWEVMVHFLEGNPDKPVVLGRMYNTEYPFPFALPAGKTKSALKSLSSPGRNGTNEIELEDKAGGEVINVLCEKDQKINVENDRREEIRRDEATEITRDQVVEIGNDQTKKIGGNFDHTVEREQTRLVKGSRERTVDGAETAVVTKNRFLTIGGKHDRRIATDEVVQAKDLTEKVGSVNVEGFAKTNTTTSNEKLKIKVGGAHLEIVGKGKSESYGKKRSELVGAVTYTRAGEKITINAKRRITSVIGLMRIQAKEIITADAGYAQSVLTGTGTFTGTSVLLKAGGSSVLLKDGVAVVHGAKVVTIAASASNQLSTSGAALIPGGGGKEGGKDSKAGGKAGTASGQGKTGSGGVSGQGVSAGSGALAGPLGKGPAAAAALQGAAADGFGASPLHPGGSLSETLRSYADKMGIRSLTDGSAIPLPDGVGSIVDHLGKAAGDYAKAKLGEMVNEGAKQLTAKAAAEIGKIAGDVGGDWLKGQATSFASDQIGSLLGSGAEKVIGAGGQVIDGAVSGGLAGASAAALQSAGLAWNAVSGSQAQSGANQGSLVVAAHPGGGGSDPHVATVVPGQGQTAPDGTVHPNVSGGGPGDKASDGSKTANQVWGGNEIGGVSYYEFVPPGA